MLQTISTIKTVILIVMLSFVLPLSAQSGNDSDGPLDAAAKKKFANAQPEDINNENFPEVIESFDFPQADIQEVVKAISKLTGKNFIIDQAASRGKITILAPSQITVAEAYRAFLAALAMNNLTVVPMPGTNILKIRQVTTAQNDSIETYTDYFPNTDQVITRIVKLKYISAGDLASKIKYLKSRQGILEAYPATNSLIITDFGSNIERISRILAQLDVPGFEEQLAVIRIYNAKSKDIKNLIEQIINKGEKSSRNVPRFRRKKTTSSKSGAESYSLVVDDERTNSIVIMGNKAGIKRIKALVKKLDFPLNPDDAGGVYVYYVRHGNAEKIAAVLNGVASDAKKANDAATGGSGVARPRTTTTPTTTSSSSKSSGSGTALFGGEVKIAADETTNSLIVTASKQDYEVMKGLLAKIDIPRDQVFVKAIIMEMNAGKSHNWGISYFNFDKASNGVGRIGFSGIQDVASLVNPLGLGGAILGFGSGETVTIQGPAGEVSIPSLVSFVNFLKSNNNGNVLSSPQVTVMDNEEATISVGEKVPIANNNNTSTTGVVSQGVQFEDADIELKITPHISPDTDRVQMKVVQKVGQASDRQVRAANLANSTTIISKREVDTTIAVDSGDTAVLGGLLQDQDTERVRKFPVLGDIPLLGWLFKSKTREKTKLNLVIFITPKIIRNNEDSGDIVNQKINERIDFIQSFMNGRDPHGYTIDTLPRKSSSNRVRPPKTLDDSDDFDDEFGSDLEEPAVESF